MLDIGWLSIGKLKGEDAKGPDVDFVCVAALLHEELWGHPAWSADLAATEFLLLCKDTGVAEIGKFDLAVC